MTTQDPAPGADDHGSALSIGELEREVGLSKDLLRVWERRYGFPAPRRGPRGERAYPADQVERLRLLKQLVAQGHRPARIVPRPLPALQALAEASAAAPRSAAAPEVHVALGLLQAHDADGLRAYLSGLLVRAGLLRFVLDMAAPLANAVGAAWSAGALAVFEEHLFTEQLSRVLRSALDTLTANGRPGGRPRVMLTTLAGEPHTLGLLMAEAMLATNGARCVSLGAETPLSDIAPAASAHGADIVALSFSAFAPPPQARRDLARLRDRLPPRVEIWAGGAGLAQAAPHLDGVRIFTDLGGIVPALAAWGEGRVGADRAEAWSG